LQVRRQARIAALQSLFEIDCAHHQVGVVLQQRLEELDLPDEGQRFTREIVQGVLAHQPELDQMIAAYAPEWPIDQMAVIDRNILRIALFEFVVNSETPPKVAINEAVELAKIFGSDSSSRFVNGVLGALLSQRATPPKRKKKEKKQVEGNVG
jgi:transcription antitermination protein NusB